MGQYKKPCPYEQGLCGTGWCRYPRVSYTTPWAIIASATFLKLVMLAPLT